MIRKLLLSKFRFHDFFNNFIVKGHTFPFFNNVANDLTNKNVTPRNGELNNNRIKQATHYISQVPPYLNVTIDKKFKNYAFDFFTGYAINIKNYDSVESYMKKQFGSKSRSKIRTYTRRLETCFSVNYKMYFGNITRENYDYLFDKLELMIQRRFLERGDKHQASMDWDYYKETVFQLILNKEASLFVIYDNKKPIDINLNYHYENVLINYIRAYDIDYSKFRLGYIDILKQLEWCLKNNHYIFDLCYGEMAYKKQWCNDVYKFKNYLLFYKKSLQNIIFGNLIVSFYKLKNKLKKNKEPNFINIPNPELSKVKITAVTFKSVKIDTSIINDSYTRIDIESNEYSFFRKAIYEHLYLTSEIKENIDIYKLNDETDTYIVKGKESFKFIKIVEQTK